MSLQYVLTVSIIRVYQEYFFLKNMNSLRQKLGATSFSLRSSSYFCSWFNSENHMRVPKVAPRCSWARGFSASCNSPPPAAPPPPSHFSHILVWVGWKFGCCESKQHSSLMKLQRVSRYGVFALYLDKRVCHLCLVHTHIIAWFAMHSSHTLHTKWADEWAVRWMDPPLKTKQ